MLGFKEDEFQDSLEEWMSRVHSDDASQLQSALHSHLAGNTIHFESEYRIKNKQGIDRWMLCRGLAVRDGTGTAYRMAGSQTDITDHKKAEERLAHDAMHDGLTRLPNRTLFLDRLSQRLEHSKRHKGDRFAVMFLDIDRFKVINDSLGHVIGDRFLITIAQRLQSCLRPNDTISRLGGDEFAILLDEIRDVGDAIRVADRIQARMMDDTLLGTVSRSSTTSIGITIFNHNYSEPQEMLRDADSAMYRAKSMGGARYQIFDVEMYKNAVALLQMETELKHAVENHEWLVYYQPIVSVGSGTITGMEALIRWNHPNRGIIPPAEFITLAEESGLIIPIGEYVLREACRRVKTLRETRFPDFWVSVNLSGRQFQDQNLLKSVQQILAENNLPGDCLRLEITETVAMQDIEYSIKILRRIEKMGIHISLDDFGNGYSSFGYLKRFPLKSLKIDRSFIRDLAADTNSEAITSAIISLAHTLRLSVVAEGVEMSEQLKFLKSQFCDEIQGFLFSRPLPAEMLIDVFNNKLTSQIEHNYLNFEVL
jgi:diguanylate cyclase (GGDEF)-like protein/PAS domain S-box-containing protein